jgi:branched-chain amino acid aminotransferase
MSLQTVIGSGDAIMQIVDIPVERVPRSRRPEVDFANLPFGTVFSDHMLVTGYRDGEWAPPHIRPYAPLPIPPGAAVLQYGISAFEGLKAHAGPDGGVLVFRAGENARRLNRSASRLAMPPVPESLFLDGLRALIRLDRVWVPPADAGALYIRPFIFGLDESLRVKPSERFLFVVLTCPVGPYFTGAIDVMVAEEYARAFPGGTGDVKAAGNYAGALVADQQARDGGFGAVLWLDGVERRYIEECGVMNAFFVIGDRVITPALSGTILPGVTRDSVIVLLRAMGFTVEERRLALDEVFDAHARGDLREAFGTGTAATVSPIGRIRHRDREIRMPGPDALTVGPAVRSRLVAIMTGREPDPYGWIERL